MSYNVNLIMKEKIMNLDKTTFGKTPASLYLADYLNKLDNQIVAKRSGKILTGFRSTLTQLENANNINILSAHNLARIISSMREKIFINVGDELASNLVTNIIVGEMKSLLRKSSNIRKIETMQNKVAININKNGEILNKKGYFIVRKNEEIFELPKYTVKEINDEINSETLIKKWKNKMNKKEFYTNKYHAYEE